MEATPKGLRLVEKTVEVLDLLATEGELTIAQLADRTGEPRSSLYRLLARLEQFELVEPASSRGYFRLGTHLLRWGAATQESLSVRDRALPVMDAIRERTGLTVYLLVRRGWHGVCVERLEGLRIASLALRLGGFLPLHAGAAPRALLAFEDERVWDEYIVQSSFEQFTGSTPSDRDQLVSVLVADRARGITISDGDVTPGIASLGAPIYDLRGRVHAALSVSGLRDEVIGADAELVESLVRAGAGDISRALGASGAPPHERGGRAGRG